MLWRKHGAIYKFFQKHKNKIKIIDELTIKL